MEKTRVLIIDHNEERRQVMEPLFKQLWGADVTVDAFPEIVAEKNSSKARQTLSDFDRSFQRFLKKGIHLLHSVGDIVLVAIHSSPSQACGEAFADWAADQGTPVLKFHGGTASKETQHDGLSFRYPYGVSKNDQPNWQAFIKAWSPDFTPDKVKTVWHLLGEREELVPMKVLAPFETLDILMQGYLTIRDRDVEERKSFMSESTRQEYGILASPATREKAEEATARNRLAPPPSEQIKGATYWFDACLEDLKDAFTPKMDEIVRKIEEQSGFGQPSLGEILDRARSAKANGALRRVVELLKNGHNDALANPEWPDGFLSDKKTQDDLVQLFREAHEEYFEAHRKIESYLP